MINQVKYFDINDNLSDCNAVSFLINYDGASKISGSKLAPNEILINNISFFNNFDYIYKLNEISSSSDFVHSYVQKICSYIFKHRDLNSLIIGGDHSITYPIFKAFSESKESNIIIFDAHADLGNEVLLKNWNITSKISKLANKVLIIGNRKKFNHPDNITQISMDDIYSSNLTDIYKVIDNFIIENTYVSIDMDVLDPPQFPGVSFPMPGGMNFFTFKKILEYILSKKVCKAIDIVEYNPLIENKYSNIVLHNILEIIKESYFDV